MVSGVRVHPRVMRRHPDISERDVQYAFGHVIRSMRRDGGHESTQYLLVGTTSDGRMIEMLAIITDEGDWFVYHAMTAINAVLHELGLKR